MSRHGLYYASEIDDVLQYGRWRGAVASAIRGRNGQAFLRELLAALDALKQQRLIGEALENEHGDVCALGAVGRFRGMNMQAIDYTDYEEVAKAFGINEKLAREIMWVNDEWNQGNDAPAMEQRYREVRNWVLENLRRQA